MIYLDSGALVKLIRDGNESDALQDWLVTYDRTLASAAGRAGFRVIMPS